MPDADAARAPLKRAGFEYRVVDAREFGGGDRAFAVVVGDLVREGGVRER